jgi:hypothetical protein
MMDNKNHMTYSGSEYSQEALLRELKKQIRDENIDSFDQYSEMVDYILEEKKSYGFLADEEDIEQLRSALESRWNEIRPL